MLLVDYPTSFGGNVPSASNAGRWHPSQNGRVDLSRFPSYFFAFSLISTRPWNSLFGESIMLSLNPFSPPQSREGAETAKQNSPKRKQITAPQFRYEACDCRRDEYCDPGSHPFKTGSSFFRLQPEIDQPADGFGATNGFPLHSDPSINCCYLLVVHSDDLRLAGARRLRAADGSVGLFGITN
jgi:hypothetical protein